MKKYLSIIFWNMVLSFKQGFYNPISATLFILAKLIRFAFFILFLWFIFSKVPAVAGFDFNDLVFYFLIFNLIDSLAQWLFRGAYSFAGQVVYGSFDYIRLYPVKSLFYSLFAYIDPFDLITLPVFIGYLIYFIHFHYYLPGFWLVIGFFISLAFSLLAVAGIHIFAMSLAFKSQVTGEVLWIWRNLAQMGRVPTKIYIYPIWYFLTYFLPVTLIINLPAMVWQGRVSWFVFILGLLADVAIFLVGLFVWQRLASGYKSTLS